MNRHAVVSTRIGELTVVVSETDLVGIYFPHHWVKPTAETLGERVESTDPLTGYAGGLKRKQFLLDLEEPVAARLF